MSTHQPTPSPNPATPRRAVPARDPGGSGGDYASYKFCPEKAIQQLGTRIKPVATGCWEWQGRLSVKGYGKIRHEGREWRAHRLMWGVTYGVAPVDRMVCHTCDNPRCVNPEHLFVGTAADNVRDMVAKGRCGAPPPRPLKACAHGDGWRVRYADGRQRCRQCERERDRARWPVIAEPRNAQRRAAWAARAGRV